MIDNDIIHTSELTAYSPDKFSQGRKRTNIFKRRHHLQNGIKKAAVKKVSMQALWFCYVDWDREIGWNRNQTFIQTKKDLICETCDYTTSLKASLVIHVKAVHEKLKDFQCDQCDYTTLQKESLLNHAKVIHEKLKDFQCDECDYTTSLTASLAIHVKAVHEKLKDFQCDECLCYPKKKSLLSHMKAHMKIYQCSFN